MRVSKHWKNVSAALAMMTAFTQANANLIGTDWERISGLVTTTGPFVLQQEIPVPASAGLFGEAVAMWHDDVSGTDWSVIGAPNEDGQAGAAYVFSFAPGGTEWKQEARLVASDRSDDDGSAFGFSVAIDHSTVVIGAPLHEADFFDGAAYVFVRDEATGAWKQQGDELNSSDSGFGFAVAVNADSLAISGAQEVAAFERSASIWSKIGTLVSPSLTRNSSFGASLAMSSNALLVGAPLDADVSPSQGSVMLYAQGRDGWELQQVLRPSISPVAFFGSSVTMSADTIGVGAPELANGQVELFGYDDLTSKWELRKELTGITSEPRSTFGYSIAMSADDLLVVGDPGSGAGYVYRYAGSAWKLDSILTGDAADDFGFSVAAANHKAIVGAPESAMSDGDAYVFIDDRIFADDLE